MADHNNAEAWVAASVAALREHGSLCGRIHVHKLLFISKELGLVDPPFDFVFYRYGPYSFGLDSAFTQMELYGQLSKTFPNEGYGARYSVTAAGSDEAASLDRSDRRALQVLAGELGRSDSQSLELWATCIWAMKEDGLSEDDQIIDRVLELKPKFSRPAVLEGLAHTRQLVERLTESA